MILVVLLATMTAAAGVFGVLYVRTSSSAETAIAEARAETRTAADARQKAETRAATAEDERDAAKADAQGLQPCQQAARDMLTALGGDADDPATLDAVNAAIRRMADTCA